MACCNLDEEKLWHEAVQHFLPSDSYSFSPTSGGVNNVVKYVESADGSRFILRVYNNGNDERKVRFEHKVLQSLASIPLSFQIPVAMPSLSGEQSYIHLSSGAAASIFKVIPGRLPKLSFVREIGRASGELSVALSTISIDDAGPNPPYYDIYKVHHAVTRENVAQCILSSDFDSVRSEISELFAELQAIEQLVEKLLALQLPQQLIHGDLHYDNVLVVEEEQSISGLLDFEFCAMDWRAMELAICLSKYAGENDPMQYFEEFIEGYTEHASLEPLEVSVIPDLINLRILSNVVYFIGRAIAGEDSIETISGKAANYLRRVRWIKAHRERITASLQRCLEARSRSVEKSA